MEARNIINSQASVIVASWPELCDEIHLSQVDRSYLWRRQILNNYAFDGYADGKPAGL
jgi:serine/threonine-protein kinase HipA